jgi:hypothetical protein
MEKTNNNKTTIDLLDDIIIYLKANEHVKTSLDTAANDLNIDRDDLHKLLLKLKEDGYIIMGTLGDISLSANGYIFQISGCYASMILKHAIDLETLASEKAYRVSIDDKLIANTDRLNRLTRWLVVGTISLAIIELIQFFNALIRCHN